MPRYVALIRGINVGGKSMMKMDDLKAVFSGLGFENVASYINSGNLAFESSSKSESKLIGQIEGAVEKRAGRSVEVMLRTRAEIEQIIEKNPYIGEYSDPKQMHVLFLKEPLSDEKTTLLNETDFGEEKFKVVGREIYALLPNGVAESIFSKKSVLEKKPRVFYTGRNFRTVERLATL